MIRDLAHVVDREKAKNRRVHNPGRADRADENRSREGGLLRNRLREISKIQIATIKELFDGKTLMAAALVGGAVRPTMLLGCRRYRG
jgi:hypothetical protein